MAKPFRTMLLSAVALPLIASALYAQQPPAQAPQTPPPGAQAPSASQPEASRPRGPQMTPADRSAMLDARIAAVKAGLRLSPDQEAMWGPLENAVRDGLTKLAELRERTRTASPPADALDRMRRQAEASLIRGEAMKRIADTARPLYATLTDEQRRRLPLLMHGPRNDRYSGRSMGDDESRDAPRRRMGPRDEDRRRGAGPGMIDRRDHEDMMRRGERWDGRDEMRRRGDRDWSDQQWDERRNGRDRDWDDRDDGPRRRWSDRDGTGRWN